MHTETTFKEDYVACEICLKQIPVSEAKSEEAQDYFVYFCGLDCHVRWEAQEATSES